jgi:hypothetical protein
MVANAFIELALADLKLGIVEIGQLQLYNQDLDDQHLDQSEGYVCSAVGRGRRDDIEPGRLRAI